MASVTEPAEKVSVHSLVNEAKADGSNLVTIEGTVDTGFEFLALEECKEKFGPSINANRSRGRIFFNIPLESLPEITELRSVDNLYLIAASMKNLQFGEQAKEDDLNKLKDFVNELQLENALKVWKTFMKYLGITSPTFEQFLEADEKRKKEKAAAAVKDQSGDNKQISDKDPEDVPEKEPTKAPEDEPVNKLEEENGNETNDLLKILKFRATCNRAGKHSFTSMEAARDFGGQLQDKYHWLVDLSHFDLEVVLNVHENEGYVGFALTKESLHRRNITHFGPTTLRATHCFNMLRLAQLKVGDIVVDPLCGGGSIPIEGAIAFPHTFHIGGDIHEKAVERSELNYAHIHTTRGPIPLDVFRWDIGKLPLKTSSVDVFATDLPFGKRSGKKCNNRPLYTKTLNEMARVLRPENGRAVLLTHDRKTLTQVLSKMIMYYGNNWRSFNINLGGLEGGVFLLKRTARLYML